MHGEEAIDPLLDFVTSAEAAGILGVSLKKLTQWRSAEIGPTYFKLSANSASRVRYRRVDLDRYIEDEGKERLELMDEKEAAAVLGVSFQLLERRRNTEEFPECLVIGWGRFARIRYRRPDVEAYIQVRAARD